VTQPELGAPSRPDRTTTPGTVEDAVVEAAKAGDEAAFAELVGRYRRELHVHCYRMLGSFEEAEDLVQETLLRAWRRRESFQGGAGFRAWLHSLAEVPWLQPYPDRLLDELAPSDTEPDAVVVARETIELTYLAVIQLLPPRQRAVLLLRDVLDWSAGETADLLDMTVAAANSALQRARATLRERLPGRPSEWSGSAPSEEERLLLEGFIDAHERADAAAAAALVREDIRITMPPHPWCFDGWPPSGPCWNRASPSPASGASCRPAPTASRRPPATSGRQATPSSAPSSSTCCASRAAASPRSPPSTPPCSPSSASHRP
jgi:RNA polymerase sigma factor (sigma-70 family)